MKDDWVKIVPSGQQGPSDHFADHMQFTSQQGYENLCWAACARMMMLNAGRDRSIEDIVVKHFGDKCRGHLSLCDETAWPNEVYSKDWQETFQPLPDHPFDRPMSQASLNDWIGNGYAVQAYFAWDTGNAHTVVIGGIYANGELAVFDPLRGVVRHAYDNVVRAYGQGQWCKTWWDLEEPAK